MKTFEILILILAIGGVSIAQDSTRPEAPPDVAVLKFGVKWKKMSISYSGGGGGLPSRGSTSRREVGGGGRDNPNLGREDREIQNRQQQADIERSRGASSTKSSLELPEIQSEGYQYSITIKNTGNKTINAVEWVFVVTKTYSFEEYTVYGRKEISPGKTRELSTVISSGNYLTLKNTPSHIRTSVMIKRIEYSDGSFWERSAERE